MPREDPSLTLAQLAYLNAFDSLLRGEPGARSDMARLLGPVLDEAGLPRDVQKRAARGPIHQVLRRFNRAA